MRRRQLGTLLFAVALLVLGSAVLAGTASAQAQRAPDCVGVGYPENDEEAYEVRSVTQLQCIGQVGTGTTLADDFVQVGDINASGTAEWNNGAGFVPIGAGTPFTGTFNGNGNEITGLTINRESDKVGLFGVIGENGGVTNSSLVNVSISGTDEVGGVAGEAEGTILRTAVTGAVAGQGRVGGVAGENGGRIEQSYAIAEIGGRARIGGLVGENDETVRTTYAAGAVSGLQTQTTGGLVGSNNGRVEESYWDTVASDQDSSNGGTGLTTAEMTGDAARDSMSAFDFRTTWEVSDSYPQLRPPSGDEAVQLSDYRESGDDTNPLTTLTMVDFAIGGGSGIVMTIALYVLASRSRREERRVERETPDDSFDGFGDAPQQASSGTRGQSSSPESNLDDRLDKLKRKIRAARVPYEKEKYERALDLCDDAIFIAEGALDTAREEAPDRVDDVEALHDKATSLRETVWEQWQETQETTGRGAEFFEELQSGTRDSTDQSRADDQPQAGEDGPADWGGGGEPPRDENEPAGPEHGGQPPIDEDVIEDPEESEDIEWHKPDEDDKQ